MSENHLEGCSPPEQVPATPTKNFQSTSISSLPSEILSNIIGQALPDRIPSTYNVDEESYPECRTSFKFGTIHPQPRPRGRAIEYRYAVLYSNKRLHAETLRILQARIFRINIGERAFSTASAADARINWVWDPVFPGLDFSNILELVVEIAPTDFRSFWSNVNTALKNLCDQQLIHRGPLKRLRIKVNDTDWSTYLRFGVWTVGALVPPRTDIAVHDYENVLKRFWGVVSKAEHSQIQLPYWMARSSAAKRIAEEWAMMGAQTLIMPAPRPLGTKDQEIGGRQWAGLAPLPDSLQS